MTDEETGFYYLQSRYYNPVVGRFISSDVLLSTGQGVIGHNAYAYCLNDPINSVDGNGNFSFKSLFSGAKLVSIGVTAIAAAATILTCGAAAPIMVAVATATAVAGTATVVNGMAEIGEGLTASSDTSNDGTNFVRDWIMGGNADAYEKQKRIFSAAAQVGTAICGAYTAAKGGNVCFVAGTQVETADGSTAIENIKEGDRVFAANPETGEVAYKKVVRTFVNETNELVEVTVNGETIKSTPSHPFYVPQKGWTSAISLRAGDILVLSNGEYVIVEQIQHELLENPVTVYNFEVEDYHTYYVSANADSDEFVLVHNKCGDIGPYNKLRAQNRGSGNEVHHLIEKRFLRNTNFYGSPKDMMSVVLTKAQHRAFTNEWRKQLAYGRLYSPDAVQFAASIVYADYPELLAIVNRYF